MRAIDPLDLAANFMRRHPLHWIAIQCSLFAGAVLAACAPLDRPRSLPTASKLPHAVLVDDGSGRRVHVHIKSIVPGGVLTAPFGQRRGAMGGGDPHRGIDIAAPKGTPVRAAAAGRVTTIGRRGGYGKVVRLRHSRHLATAYAHLSGFAGTIGAGQWVERGEIIGYVGTSGRTTGPHLHFEIIRFGRPANPLRFQPV